MVAAVRGDDLLQYWRAPDFVKMDVEGAEFDVLSGCETLLGTVRPVFYIEVSPQNQDRVSELFHQHDYRIFHLQGDGNEKPVETCSFYTIARPR